MILKNKLFVILFFVIVAVVILMAYIELKNIKDWKNHTFQKILRLNKSSLETSKAKNLSFFPFQSMQPTSFFVNSSTFLSDVTIENNKISSMINETQDCSEWAFPATFKEIKGTQIVLNSDKFLYPGLIWGPNNQIIGLKNSIYLAITLNRTLVLPSFFAQYTHSGMLSPFQAIDAERLCSFVPCISVGQLRERCNAFFDVVFEGMASKLYYIKKQESITGMKIMHPKKIWRDKRFARNLSFSDSDEIYKIPTFPGTNHTLKYGHMMPADQTILQSVFNTTAPCAIYASVCNSIKIKPIKDYAISMTSLNKTIQSISKEGLYSAITDAVRHPPCIVKAAKNYIRDVLNNRLYAALHWRYDTDDFIRIACRNPQPVWSRTICADLKKIKPLHIAKAIVRAVQTNSVAVNLTIDVVPVYVAAPPTLKNFVDEVYTKLQQIDKRYIKPSSGIRSYLKSKYSLCWEKHQWKNIEEIVSLTEMELMINSFWFFFSPGSTWSQNVRFYRIKVNKDRAMTKFYEGDILKLAKMKNKTSKKNDFV